MLQAKTARRLLACLALAFANTGITLAQTPAWPTKPVRVVVSFPPGAPGDVIARLIQNVFMVYTGSRSSLAGMRW